MNLYQKYRPRTLSDFLGSEKTVKEFRKRFKDETVPQVVMLHGHTGLGKTTLGRIIAKHKVCQNKTKRGVACDECQECVDIDNELFRRNVAEYNASNIDIEATRKIDQLSTTNSLIANNSNKVIIIDEFQELNKNKSAQKNLLKTLEVVNKNVTFILLTMDYNKIPSAIKNRAVLYRLNTNSEEIGVALANICEKEGIEVDEEKIDVLYTIADYSAQSFRTAISYLERAIYSNLWTVNDLVAELGIVNQDTVLNMTGYLLTGQSEKFYEHELNEDVLRKIIYTLTLIAKVQAGADIGWQSKSIGSLYKKLDSDLVIEALDLLTSADNYFSITQQIIDILILKVFKIVKEVKK